jgi:hypothetical protein
VQELAAACQFCKSGSVRIHCPVPAQHFEEAWL